MIQNEVNNLLTGRGQQIRDFLGKLDTFTDQLNEQRDDITHAIDSTNRLLAIRGDQNRRLDRVLTEFPPLIKHFADPEYQKHLFDAVESLGGSARLPPRTCVRRGAPLHQPAACSGR